MSWEEMSCRPYPCPCGTGEYNIVTEMDDWNTVRANWVMICPNCKTNYVLWSYEVIDSGMSDTRHFWVKKEIAQQYNELTDDAERKIETARSLMQQRYMAQWQQHFLGKNKKAIWSVLTNQGLEYPALGTFYNHVKADGLDAYLERYFFTNIERVLHILGAKDKEVGLLLADAQALKTRAELIIKDYQ